MIPVTLDSSVPCVTSSYLILATIVALAVYGFRTTIAGQPIFSADFLHDEPARS
jgi:hypothetical protein